MMVAVAVVAGAADEERIYSVNSTQRYKYRENITFVKKSKSMD